MDDSLYPRFFLLIGLLFVSGFFSGSEVAFFSLSRMTRERLKKTGGRTGAKVDALLSNPQRLLVSIYIGNELVNVAISAVATFLALSLFGDAGLAVALGAGTFALLVFGEINPKTVAHHNNEKWALLAAYPLSAFVWAIHPFQVVVTGLAGSVVRLMGGSAAGEGGMFTEEEFKTLMEEAAEEGIIAEEEKEMIHGVFEMGEGAVEDVMTPRTDLVALEVDTPLKEAWDIMAKSPYARAPVYRENIDNIEGILFKKDLLKLEYPPDPAVTLKSLLREPFIVPETMTISELLREFKKRKAHMAIAMDEYGGTQGVVTMEDIISELVGESAPNGREADYMVTRLAQDVYRVSASLPLEDFNERFGASLGHGEIETIGGFVFHLFGRAPSWGEKVETDGFSFTVEGVKGHRITELKVRLKEEVEG
ncbi:MAG: hemolysin family protein [Candidatus Nitrospinota bacterium M3_3B_026]